MVWYLKPIRTVLKTAPTSKYDSKMFQSKHGPLCRTIWTCFKKGKWVNKNPKADESQVQTRSIGGTKFRKAICPEFSADIKNLLKCRKDMKLEVCMIDDFTIHPDHCPPSVVIVGAGLAGLSAAQRLVSCGITDVIVLEAQDRPGGRIHSCWLDEAVVELGAQWIEGACAANSVFTLACQEGLLRAPLLRQNLNKGLHMNSQGRDLGVLVNATAYRSFNLIDEQAADLYSHSDEDVNPRDLGSFLKARIPQELEVFPNEYRNDVSSALFGMTQELRSRLGEDLCKIAANQYGSNWGPPGGNVKVGSGMIGILAPLIRFLPECVIKYCKPVENIKWDSEEVVIKCCDGDVFCPDYCICTVSLGVLKAEHEKLFSPKLPEDKIEAIEKLGYGHIDNFYASYKRPFWIWEEGTVRLAWTLDELADSANQEWTKNMGVIEEMPNSTQVLMCSVTGEKPCKTIEQKDEGCLAEDITRILRQFLNDPTLPYPCNVIRSKWSSNKFFRGAKSYIAVGSTVGHQCTLAGPIPEECGKDVPRLLFAGEATCPGHHATVQGARISGVREAERILRLTKKLCGPPSRKYSEEEKKEHGLD